MSAPNADARLCVPTARIVSLLLPRLLSGCSYLDSYVHNGFKVGPNYAKPAVPIADHWIDFNDPRVISERHGVNDQAWWQAFQDPALDRLVRSAYQQNLPLRVAGLRVLEARAQRAIAAGDLFPQFQEAFGNLQHRQISNNSLGVAPVGAGGIRAFDLWDVGVSTSWELDVWGRFRRAIESADANVDVEVENHDDVLVCLIAETAATYVEIRQFQQQLDYLRDNVITQEKALSLAEIRVKAGEVDKLDVTQASSNLERTRAVIPVRQLQLRQANNRLCILLGIPPRDLTVELGRSPIPSASSQVVLGVPADLIRRRPDVRRAEREVARQSALIGVAAADLFPTLSIAGTLNWQATTFGSLFEPASSAGVISPGLNWNILNYGRLANNVRVQDVRFQQLAVSYQQTVLAANADVENSVIAFLKFQEEVRLLRLGVEATTESVRIAQTQYKAGAIDFDRVNNLQRDLVVQQDELARAEGGVANSLIAVYKSLGGGWQIRLQRLPPPTAIPASLPVPAPVITDMPEDLPEAPMPPARPNENS